MESGHNSAERPRDAAPIVGERRADWQVNDDAPNRRFDPRPQLQQAQPQGADLGTSAPGPPGLEAKLLHQHIGGSTHQHPQLVGEETRSTGAVDLKAELEFLQPVFNIAPGAVNVLVDVPRRGLEIGDHETRIVFRLAPDVGGHFRLDDHPALVWPTPGLVGVLAVPVDRFHSSMCSRRQSPRLERPRFHGALAVQFEAREIDRPLSPG